VSQSKYFVFAAPVHNNFSSAGCHLSRNYKRVATEKKPQIVSQKKLREGLPFSLIPLFKAETQIYAGGRLIQTTI
jgi:hypothetical protein